MTDLINRQIVLKSRPVGAPTESNFELIDSSVPEPSEGQFLARTIYLTVDPYMRGRMSGLKTYIDPQPVNAVMQGGTVSQVIKSRHGKFSEGDFLLGFDGWQEYAVSDGKGAQKLDPLKGSLSLALGVLGMPGLTAYSGLLDMGKPKAGETVVVSAAAGAVGSVVGQIAKIKGCRAVGFAGSAEKCQIVKKEFGFDACINYKTENLHDALRIACPQGIDVYFDNVAGDILDAVLQQINVGARIPLVGMISQYNAVEPPPGPNLLPVLIKRATIQGFIVSDHFNRMPEFLRDVSQWIKEGPLKYREHLVHGIDEAPRAFLGLFRGENVGKVIVQVSDDPHRLAS